MIVNKMFTPLGLCGQSTSMAEAGQVTRRRISVKGPDPVLAGSSKTAAGGNRRLGEAHVSVKSAERDPAEDQAGRGYMRCYTHSSE